LGSDAKVIAKIETPAAANNLESVMQVTDAAMVARGDLALEVSPEAVPIIQRKIVSLGLQYNKPTIVATQMLASMTEEPEPTRAEVSDVATAVLVGADAVMLSDETATGKYPHDAVKMMRRIIIYTQENAPVRPLFNLPPLEGRQAAISEAIIRLADKIRAKAIVAETRSGATALSISVLRPLIPIIAVTSMSRTAQQMALYYGCLSYVRPDDPLAASKMTDWLRTKKIFKKGDMVVTASGKYPGIVGMTDTIKVRVLD
jgi:pyruvate kinase